MNKLLKLRLEKGLSMQQAAIAADVGTATLMRLERDGKAYKNTLYKLANYYGVDYQELEREFGFEPKKLSDLAVLNQEVA